MHLDISDCQANGYPRVHDPRADPLTVEVVGLIGTVVARYYEEYEQAATEHSLTGAQARVLSLLSVEPLPMRKIAQRLKCEPSNITGIVDRLESAAWSSAAPIPLTAASSSPPRPRRAQAWPRPCGHPWTSRESPSAG